MRHGYTSVPHQSLAASNGPFQTKLNRSESRNQPYINEYDAWVGQAVQQQRCIAQVVHPSISQLANQLSSNIAPSENWGPSEMNSMEGPGGEINLDPYTPYCETYCHILAKQYKKAHHQLLAALMSGALVNLHLNGLL